MRTLLILTIILFNFLGLSTRIACAKDDRYDEFVQYLEDQDRLRTEGFEFCDLDSFNFVPLKHNEPDQISEELQSPEFLAAIARAGGTSKSETERLIFTYRTFFDGDSASLAEYPTEMRRQVRNIATEHYLALKLDTSRPEMAQKVKTLAEQYVNSRLAGHTRKFSLAALKRANNLPPSGTNVFVAALHRQFPEIPLDWQAAYTNIHESVSLQPAEGVKSDRWPRQTNIVCSFRIDDGPISWFYTVATNVSHSSTPEKVDSRQFDPKYTNAFADVRMQVDKILIEKGLKGEFGSVHTAWDEKRRLLKEQYSIEWLSPRELNLNTHYD